MTNIFLAPRSNETSHENFESTIIGGRPYSFVESYLTDDEKKVLSQFDTVSVWGNKESLKARWDKMNPGDYVLFYAKGTFYYSAQVVLTTLNHDLGRALWPNDEDGNPWPCLFFVTNIKEVNIPIKVVQELAGYEPTWDRVQGFMPMRESGIKAIADKFGSIEAFLEQDPEFFEAVHNLIEENKSEVVESEVDEVVDMERVIREAQEYKDTGDAYVMGTTLQKRRVENKKQKQRVAEIENHRCQVCGWSLEWTNSKGKRVMRIDIDHIIEKSEGGGEELSNLWALCPNCHVKKTLGVIKVDLKKKIVTENGEEIQILDNHLFN
jgi:rubredoxin